MTSDLIDLLARITLALGAAIALVLAGRRLVRRAFGPALAYRLWLIVPAAVLACLLPFGPSDFTVMDLVPAAGAPVAVFAPGVEAPPVYAPSAPSVDWSLAIAVAWLAGALAFAALVLREHRRAIRAYGPLIRSELDGTTVCRTQAPGPGPSLVGVFNLRLVVPADFEDRFSPAEQRLVLAHEDHHRRAGDPIVNGLVALIRCLNWFNPLVHIGAINLRIDQELACDAAVLARRPGERRTYAEALVKTQLSSAPTPLGCHWPVKSHALMMERLSMLALNKPGRLRLIGGALLISLLSFAAGATAWATLAPHGQFGSVRVRMEEPAVEEVRMTPADHDDGIARPAPAPPAGGGYAPFPAFRAMTFGPRAEVVSRKVDASRVRASGAADRNRRAVHDAARIAAAVKGGWTHEVLEAGGSATDVVASLRAEGWKDRMLPLPGTEQFAVLSDGEFGIAGVRRDGTLVIINDGGFDEWPEPKGTPDAATLKARLAGG